MTTDPLIYRLADIAGLAQVQFQRAHKNIDPVIGVNRKMRQQGFAVDLLTIDCVTNGRRITFLMDDATPDTVKYQFSKTDKDPELKFVSVPLARLGQQKFFDLMSQGLV